MVAKIELRSEFAMGGPTEMAKQKTWRVANSLLCMN